MHTDRLVCFQMIDTKEFIVESAYRLFLTKSYEAVSISDICKEVGFTKGALYHHFRNKEELFMAVIDKFMKVITLGELEPGISLEKYIEEHVKLARQIVDAIQSSPAKFVPVNYLSLIIDAFRHYPEYDKANIHLFSTETERIQQVLDHAIQTGEIRGDINTRWMALNFLSISFGLAANLFHVTSADTVVDTYRHQLNEFYHLLKI